jgi:hypothetical protein
MRVGQGRGTYARSRETHCKSARGATAWRGARDIFGKRRWWSEAPRRPERRFGMDVANPRPLRAGCTVMVACIGVLLCFTRCDEMAAEAAPVFAAVPLPLITAATYPSGTRFTPGDLTLAKELADWVEDELALAQRAVAVGGSAEVRLHAGRLITIHTKTRAALRELVRREGQAIGNKQRRGSSTALLWVKEGAEFDLLYWRHLRTGTEGMERCRRIAIAASHVDLRRIGERTLGELRWIRPEAARRHLANVRSQAKRAVTRTEQGSKRAKARKTKSSAGAGKASAVRKSSVAKPKAKVKPTRTTSAPRQLPSAAHGKHDYMSAPKARVVRFPRGQSPPAATR